MLTHQSTPQKTRVFSALSFALLLVLSTSAYAATTTLEMYRATPDGRGERLGTVSIEETNYGLVFTPALNGLEPGVHGFHVHTNGEDGPSKDPKTGATIPAGAAGGHFDPAGTNRHGFPWEDSAHLGDLPPLIVTSDGLATTAVLAPRLKTVAEVRDRVLMIHEGGDNHSDHPKPLGGGGARIASGIIR